jgi:hypothetical protein
MIVDENGITGEHMMNRLPVDIMPASAASWLV